MRLILTSGLSLIEVLVSLFLLSLVLLGLDAMVISSARLQLKVYYASLAEQQLQNMTQRLRLDANVSDQVLRWNQENQLLLPQGRGWVEGIDPAYSIKLCWGEEGLEREGHAGCASTDLLV